MVTEDTRRQPSGFSTFLWAIFFFFIFALIVIVWVRGSGPKDSYEDKRGLQRAQIREDLLKQANEKLASAAWVDQAKGVVRIPIADAKSAVLAELKSKEKGPSQVKVDPWLPPALPADPNSTEPPIPALTSAPQGAETVRFEAAPAIPGAPAPAPMAPAPPPAGTAPTPPAPAPAAPAPAAPAPGTPAPAPAVPAAPAK
jgi:hypothetical protein